MFLAELGSFNLCYSAQSLAYRRCPVAVTTQSMWDMWWTKWRWRRYFSEHFGFLLSPFKQCGCNRPIWGRNNTELNFVPLLYLIKEMGLESLGQWLMVTCGKQRSKFQNPFASTVNEFWTRFFTFRNWFLAHIYSYSIGVLNKHKSIASDFPIAAFYCTTRVSDL
jgi:hypothetical protein